MNPHQQPDPSAPSAPPAHSSGWYYALGSAQRGPLELAQLIHELAQGDGATAMVFGPGLPQWVEARSVPAIIEPLRTFAIPTPLPPDASPHATLRVEIFGQEMQFVEMTLAPGESFYAEAGAMMSMTAGIELQTVMGDPSAAQGGLFGKLSSGVKRLVSGASLFVTCFRNTGAGIEKVALAAPYPGKIIVVDLAQLGGELICQRESFLCASNGIRIGVAFQRRLGAGMFGGEGFVMQRLTGSGAALIHSGGTLVRHVLAAGEELRIDTGCLVAMTPNIDYDINLAGGLKTALFGGEGLFLAHLTGPGVVWLQSLPFARLARKIRSKGYFRRKDG